MRQSKSLRMGYSCVGKRKAEKSTANRKCGSVACHFRFRWQLSQYLSENVDRSATIWVSEWMQMEKHMV